MEVFNEVKDHIINALNKMSISALKLTTGNAVHDSIGIACTADKYKRAIEYRIDKGVYDNFSTKEKEILNQLSDNLDVINRRAQTITTKNVEQEKVLLSNFIKSVIKYYGI